MNWILSSFKRRVAFAALMTFLFGFLSFLAPLGVFTFVFAFQAGIWTIILAIAVAWGSDD